MKELMSWKDFELLNKDNIKDAFQRMCTYLFCYTYRVNELCEEPNHPGIETYPVMYRKKKYGFQSKHFDNRVDYEQIKGSVKSLLNSQYKDELDFFVLYCNKDLSDCPSLRQIRKDLKDNGIKLKIVSNNEILRLISTKGYYVIYNLFFRQSLIFDNYKFNIVKNNELESIINEKFIDLKLSGKNISEFELENNTSKITLIEGYAGSGKSVAMYYLYRKMFMIDRDYYYQAAKLSSNRIFGIYIDFKIHKHNCKEELLSIVTQAEKYFTNHSLIIFLDGFDEITDDYARELAAFLSRLCSKSIVRQIIISCRSLSLKKHYLVHNIFELSSLKIYALTKKDKIEYAKTVLGNDYIKFSEMIKTEELVQNIDDPLCLSYVIESITAINHSSDVFDIIKVSIERKIKDSIPVILEPQIENVFGLLRIIALRMYKSFDYITLEQLHELIVNQFPKLSYAQINRMIDSFYSSGLLMECDNGIVFKHKRIYELFLVEYIFQKYLIDINILNEVNIFKEEDLFENLFLPKLYHSVKKTKLINLIAEYNLFKTYMNENNSFGADENSIIYSDFFVDSFCSYDDQTIIDLLESNSKIKKWFMNPYGNQLFLNNNDDRNRVLFHRINKSDYLVKQLSDVGMDESLLKIKEEKAVYNGEEINVFDYLSDSLKRINNQRSFYAQYCNSFIRIIEYAMNKCDILHRSELILRLNKYELDCLCKTIFYPNLMVLLYDEVVVNTIISQINKYLLDSLNSMIFLMYFNQLSEEHIEEIKQSIKDIHFFIDEYNIVHAKIFLKMYSTFEIEIESVIRDTKLLLENRISCEEYAEEVYKSFDYVRKNKGNHGKQYHISVFALRFLTSLLTNNEISIRCLNQFLKHKYLNVQLLAILKKAKPDLMRYSINQSMAYVALQNDLEVFSSIEEKVDRLFQISFILSDIDYERSLYYFYQGYSESIIRLLYSKDATITPLLVDSFITVYDYLSDTEKNKYLFEIFDMIEWANQYTDDGTQLDSIINLAKKVCFEKNEDRLRYIHWLKSNNYWNQDVAYNVLFTMLNNNVDIHFIWEVYSKYIQHQINEKDTSQMDLRFLIAIHRKSEMYSDLYETTEHLIQTEGFENVSVILSWKEKTLFDILCKTNKSTLKQIDLLKKDKPNAVVIDVDNIIWNSDSPEYWMQIIKSFIERNRDVNQITAYLKKALYPNIDGSYHENWNNLLYIGLNNSETRELFYDLLIDNSGYCGFYCLIKAYKNDSKQCVELYRRYHQFCQLLTRK